MILPGATGHHEHGTRARYVQGCRCEECRAANLRRYHEKQARGRELAALVEPSIDGRCPGPPGEVCPTRTKLRKDSANVCGRCRDRMSRNGLVDAKPARAHLRTLSRQGVGYKQAADSACVSTSVVAEILSGRKKRIRKSTSDRILEVTREAAADHALVPAGPTRVMLRALETEFLTKTRLARALGSKSREPALQIGRKRVTARTEAKVRRLYEQTFGEIR